MKETWQVKVWGVRGAIPVPDADFLEYGGNTSCISLECGSRVVIFDVGSGLTGLGNELRRAGKKRADILLGHLHADHLCGLFGFPLFFDPEAEVHLYGPAGHGPGLEAHLRTLVGTPYWPLGFTDFPAGIHVHETEAGAVFSLSGGEADGNDVTIRTLEGSHPGGCLYYRAEGSGRSVIYALDCETDEEMFGKLQTFARDGDLIIWDANFSEEELPKKKGWGHSSWKQGIALGRAAGVKKVLMTHYSWEYQDSFLHKQEELAAREDQACSFAREGMVIEI